MLEFMERADAFRRPERFAQALLACEADARGRTGLENEALSAARLSARRARRRGGRSSRRRRTSPRAPARKSPSGLHRSRARAIAAVRERLAVDPRRSRATYRVWRRSLSPKAAQRRVGSAQPGHGLEALAHLARQHQLPRLIGEPRMAVLVAAGERVHLAVDSQPRQEMRLRREARERVSRPPRTPRASRVKSTHAVMS